MLGRFNNRLAWLPAWAWLVVGAGLITSHVLVIRSLQRAASAAMVAPAGAITFATMRRMLSPTWMERHALRIDADGSIRSDELKHTGGPDGLGFWTITVQGPPRSIGWDPQPFEPLRMTAHRTCTLDATVWKSTGKSDDEGTWKEVRQAIDASLLAQDFASSPIPMGSFKDIRTSKTIATHDYPASVERVLCSADRSEWVWGHIAANFTAGGGLVASVVGLVLLAFPSKRERARAAMMRHFCPSCGYDLRGSVGDVCPECGAGQNRAPR